MTWKNNSKREAMRQALIRERKSFSETLMGQDYKYNLEIQKMRALITAFEKLPWYKKLWLAIMELFGYKISILKKMEKESL